VTGARQARAPLTPGPRELEPLGRMVRRLRTDADLTLERLSEASGISDRALSDIERGAARGPQHRTVLAVAGALALTDGDRAALLRAARDGRRRATPSALTCLPLPPDAVPFLGREREQAILTTALTRAHGHRPSLTVITGPPGYGKTALAVRAAALVESTLPDQLFVDLGDVAYGPPSPADLVAWLVSALTHRRTRDGDAGVLRHLLADRPLLLVLDDAAHESQVRALLPALGRVAVLVTSRRPLAGLDVGTRVRLDRLGARDARCLLAAVIPSGQRAGADLPGLARLCDHVPLALRIVGNRLASCPEWTVGDLVTRMTATGRRLDTLTAGDLRMADAIRPSVSGLGADARRLFRRLALVDGRTFGAGLAGALAGRSPRTTETLLDELADLSLIQPVAGDRYAVHDLLQLYARAEFALESPATRRAVRARTDDWLVATAGSAAAVLRPGSRTPWSVDPARGGPLRQREPARAWLLDEVENWSAALRRVLRRDRGALPDGCAEAAAWLRRSPAPAQRAFEQRARAARVGAGLVPFPRSPSADDRPRGPATDGPGARWRADGSGTPGAAVTVTGEPGAAPGGS
jgi:transcriptional regulator with XRE-family HTH domain